MANLIRTGDRSHDLIPDVWDALPRLFQDLARWDWDPFGEMAPATGAGRLAAFAPRFEVKESADGYLFTADVPGLEEKDLELQVTSDRLTVNGARRAEERREGDTYYACERSYGSFSRTFTLPEGADTERATASLENGVLTVSIPKKAEAQPRRIAISARAHALGEKLKGMLGAKDKHEA